MLSEDNIIKKLKETLSEKRFLHTLGVRNTAVTLAEIYTSDTYKASIAGLLHDCAKDFTYSTSLELCKKYNVILNELTLKNSQLIHGPLGAAIAKAEYGVEDKEILDAIYYHTLTREDMSLLEKIICVADFVEPNRKMPIVDEIRKISFESLDKALIEIFKSTIDNLSERHMQIHPSKVKALQYLQKKLK